LCHCTTPNDKPPSKQVAPTPPVPPESNVKIDAGP
jgi:hypothetical protein